MLSIGLFAPARSLVVPTMKQMMPRRGMLAAGVATLVTAPAAFAEKKPASDGRWAKRFEAFEDEEFADFKTAPSGLQYKVVEEGYGVKPLSGQKIKVSLPLHEHVNSPII